MFVGYQHMYLHAFACPGSNNILKLFLRLRIVYIIHPQKILEFHIKDGISCLSVILGDCTLQGLLEKSGSLTHDGTPACHDLLKILRSCLLWFLLLYRCCTGHCRPRFPGSTGLALPNDHLLHRPFLHLLFQDTKPVKNRVQICLHGRSAQLDQCDFHQYTLLACKTDLIGQIGKNTNVTHQRLHICHPALFLQKLQILRRNINGFLRIFGSLHKQKISHIPGKI